MKATRAVRDYLSNKAVKPPPEARQYLASIGAKGGRISRRVLTTEQARAMVRAREAKRAQTTP